MQTPKLRFTVLLRTRILPRPPNHVPRNFFSQNLWIMGKKNKAAPPDELHLTLPPHPRLQSGATPIVDTHTHILSTYTKYRSTYTSPKYGDVFAFARGLYQGTAAVVQGSDTSIRTHGTEAIIDVWCEAPVTKQWKELADSALSEASRRDKWGGVHYWFVMGVHPLHAEHYTDETEREILVAMAHPRCVGWGEIGLDYHYKGASHEVQQAVFTRQLRYAVKLGKPLTIHTREAEEDTERILKAEVLQEHPIHIHCFTDSPEYALRLLEYFPNLYIGITGVITYSTNHNTPNLIRALVTSAASPLRILLETDAPYMTPATIYTDLPALPSNARLPLCHTGMVPWTADFVAKIAESVVAERGGIEGGATRWDMERVMCEARANARRVYGV